MRFRSRRAAVAASIIGAVVVFPTLSVGAQAPVSFPKATFGQQGPEISRLTTGFQMTREETAPTRGFTAPSSMAVKPGDPKVVVAASADLRTRRCHLLVSTDAGRVWRFSETPPALETYEGCTNTTAGIAAASLEWGSGGTLYYAMQAYGEGEGPREGGSSIVLARTTNLGDTWTHTLVNDSRSATGVRPTNIGVTALGVDTTGAQDAVYVGYYQLFTHFAPEDSPIRNTRPVVVSTSTDGGATFGEPVNLNEFSQLTARYGDRDYPVHFQTAFGRPFLTADNGVILVVGDSGPPSDDAPPREDFGGIFAEALPMIVARSTDAGQTWTVSELSPPVFNSAGSHTGMGWTPDGGPDGTFVFAYSATPENADSAGRTDVVMQRSTDLGVTWSEPVSIVDDNPGDFYSSFYPQLNVAPNGRVDVVFQTNRDLSDYLINTMYTFSTDGGVTWSPNVVVSDRPADFSLGISFNSDLRYVPGVASANEYVAVGWADTRNADETTQTQDAYSVVAQFSPLPSDSNTTLPILAAVFGGLVAAGVVLLLVMSSRRKAPTT